MALGLLPPSRHKRVQDTRCFFFSWYNFKDVSEIPNLSAPQKKPLQPYRSWEKRRAQHGRGREVIQLSGSFLPHLTLEVVTKRAEYRCRGSVFGVDGRISSEERKTTRKLLFFFPAAKPPARLFCRNCSVNASSEKPSSETSRSRKRPRRPSSDGSCREPSPSPFSAASPRDFKFSGV